MPKVLIKYMLCLCLLGIIHLPLYAQHFQIHKRRVSVPAQVINNIMIIKMYLNDTHIPLHFIVDTGVKNTILVEESIKGILNLSEHTPFPIIGLGSSEVIMCKKVYAKKVSITPGLYAQNLELLIIKDSIFNLSSSLGLGIDGIIGYDLFKDVVLQTNYINKKIKFYDKNKYPIERKKSNREVIPLKIIHGKPHIHIQIKELGKDISKSLMVLIDLGASFSSLLYSNDKVHIDTPKVFLDASIGKGLSGEYIKGKIGVIESLSFGKTSFKYPIANYPEKKYYQIILKNTPTRSGSIGGDISRRFCMTFIYSDSILLLKPNLFMDKKFTYNKTGIEIASSSFFSHTYQIKNIRKNSPADMAGLRAKDIILKINRVNVTISNYEEINAMLLDVQKRKLDIQIIRNGEVLNFTLQISDPLFENL